MIAPLPEPAGAVSGAVTIRPVEPAEHDEVAALTVSVYAQVMGELLSDEYRARLADVAARAAQALVLVAVAEPGGVLAALTYVEEPGEFAEMGPDEASVRMLAVAPHARRRGLARALVGECLDRARRAGKSRVVLHTMDVMVEAQRLYESMGFVRHPVTDFPLSSGGCVIGYRLELRSPAA